MLIPLKNKLCKLRFWKNPLLLLIIVILTACATGEFNVSVADNDTNGLLPNSMLSSSATQKIAVLLPVANNVEAKAIWQGFLYAYYQQPANIRPQLLIYDTDHINVANVYNTAVKAGANFIVGPLLQSAVESVATITTPIPTLALNYSKASPSNNIYEFGLSSRHDAQQIAQQIVADKHTKVLSIVMDTPISQALTSELAQQLAQAGASNVETIGINSDTDLNSTLADALGVTQSQQRAALLKGVLRRKFSFIPSHRQDIDAIFLNVTPSLARQIMPALRYLYAGNIPVYATSLLYSGIPAPDQDNDLNGIMFTDTPWAINAASEIQAAKQALAAQWGNSYYAYNKLYALGIDSYYLIGRLSQLQASTQNFYTGKTGKLYLAPNHQIVRELSWAKFDKGVPVLLNSN